jgi:lysophospholipase L1-like esterase
MDGGGSGGAGGTGGTGGSNPQTWDWNGIVGTGQSLSVGTPPILTLAQPYANLKLSLGSVTVPPFDAEQDGFSMVPLVEPIRQLAPGFPSPYPRNIYGETPHSAMGNQITALARAAGGDYVSVHTVVGESGQGMTAIEKGATDTGTTGRAYAATLFEAAVIAALAERAGKTYGIAAIVIVHGESDAGNTNYASDLHQLWSDYNADLLPLTGQTAKIPMLVSQQNSVPDMANQRSPSSLAQWRVGVEYPGDIVCVGPKYQYPYDDDGVHLTSAGYRRLGEKIGQAYHEKVVRGTAFRPLEPTRVVRASNRVVRVEFNVPVPPLVWDDALPEPHQNAFTEWAEGRGFELRNGGSRLTIGSVAISGNAVEITCASDLPASGVFVGYAMTADGTKSAGGTFRSGQLRDSDPFVGSATRLAQPNYCVGFELAVP